MDARRLAVAFLIWVPGGWRELIPRCTVYTRGPREPPWRAMEERGRRLWLKGMFRTGQRPLWLAFKWRGGAAACMREARWCGGRASAETPQAILLRTAATGR